MRGLDFSEAAAWFKEGRDLALAIVSAVSSGAERRRRGGHGRAMVESEFGWPPIARRFEAIYDEVVDSQGRSPASLSAPLAQ